MPFVQRAQVVATLREFVGDQDVEACLKEALQATKLKDKPLFKPEEVALVGRAVMARASRLLATPPTP